jgi:mannose-1-phosphate guanylyltransferase
MQTLILVGGEATRLRPLTCNTPKAMVPVMNKPFLEHAIDYLKSHGIDDIVLAQGYLPQPMYRHFKDGKQFNTKLTYVIEDKPLGTAGAVKNASEYLDGPFFVFNGDILTDLDITAMLEFHRRKKAAVTLSLVPVDDPRPFGVVETDKENRITSFKEKPKLEEISTNMINAGIYIIEPDVLNQIPADTFYSFEKQVFPDMLKNGEHLYAFNSPAYWIDIGTPQKYMQVHIDILNGSFKNKERQSSKIIGENCRIDPTAVIEGNAMIGNNCIIAKNATIKGPAVIGGSCRILENSIIEETIVWNNVTVENEAVISGSLIADNCILGAKSRLENTVIGDNIKISPRTQLGPGSRIWP